MNRVPPTKRREPEGGTLDGRAPLPFVSASGRGARLLFVLIALCLFVLAWGHPANVPSSEIKVAADGTFVARIRFDALAFATGAAPKDADDAAMSALLDGPPDALRAALADAAGRFRQGFAADRGGVIDRLDFPNAETVARFLAGKPSPRLPVMLTAVVVGHLPPGSRTVSFRYPATFDTIIQTVEFPYQEPASEPVDPGQASSTLSIPSAAEIARTAAAFQAPRAGSVPKSPIAPPPPKAVLPQAPAENAVVWPGSVPLPKAVAEAPKPPQKSPASAAPVIAPPAASVAVPPSDAPVPAPRSIWTNVGTYLRMGFTHILPEGLDHILFVLGLFLLGSNTKALVKQITAFTVAHSITLALTALGLIHLPGRIIEPVIAISIAFVAIENIFTQEVRPWRTAVVFLFGLIHGMGFAEVFAEAGLRGSGLLTALVSFNVGVELGQLSVVAMAFGLVGWFRADKRYRQVVVVPASLLIALVALFWTAQRIIG